MYLKFLLQKNSLGFYMPVEDGTYYGITCDGWVGSIPHSLSAAYLQNYTSYDYETSRVDRSHEGGVQCTRIIALACLIFESSPFVIFHT